MPDPTFEKLQDAVRRLNGLLQDPQPGYVTWMAAVQDVWSQTFAAAGRVGLNDTALARLVRKDIYAELLRGYESIDDVAVTTTDVNQTGRFVEYDDVTSVLKPTE